MFTLGKCLLFLTATVVIVQTAPTLVKFYPCRALTELDNNSSASSNCTVNKVWVDPCGMDEENEDVCIFSKGTNGTISFDFTPKFSTSELYARVYSSMFLIDLPFPGMDSNACNYTTCPTVPLTPQKYTYTIEVLDVYPSGPYTVKWRVWTATDEQYEECCFLQKIVIT